MIEMDQDLLGIYASLGWGRLEVVEKASGYSRVAVKVWDNFEVLGTNSDRPSCQFVRGVVAGFLSVVAHRSLACEEVECQPRGRRPARSS